MWRNANLSLNVAFVRSDPHATRSTAGWRLMISDNFTLWHASLRHPAGNIPLPEGEPCMYTYIFDFFVSFGSHVFVRALLAKTLSTSTQKGHSEPVVEVWARSEHCNSRGALSFFFFKQKTAYEIASCFVGSEMCIRDSPSTVSVDLSHTAAADRNRWWITDRRLRWTRLL